ncbi:MAG: preprotein translocase subunit YajC [Planctomycetota bacterium]|jgi:preprotein translocase YajC subunit
MNNVWILAQAETEEAPSSVGAGPVTDGSEHEGATKADGSPDANTSGRESRGPGGLLGSPILLIGLMLVMFYFILFRGPRKKQQQHKQMVQSLKKNDRVRTIGGIVGTVVANNTKIRVVPSAIGRNLSQDEK